jgi:hypothetical protein
MTVGDNSNAQASQTRTPTLGTTTNGATCPHAQQLGINKASIKEDILRRRSGRL